MITPKEARKKANELTFPYNMFFEDYISQQEKVAKLLELKERLSNLQQDRQYLCGIRDTMNNYNIEKSMKHIYSGLNENADKIIEVRKQISELKKEEDYISQQEKVMKLLKLYEELSASIIDDVAFLNEEQRDILQQIGVVEKGLK